MPSSSTSRGAGRRKAEVKTRGQTIFPAFFWEWPPEPGETDRMTLEWNSAIEAVNMALRSSSSELLIIPDSRMEEAVELTGSRGEPTILASRVKLLDSKDVDGRFRVKVKGLHTVKLKALSGRSVPFSKFTITRIPNPLIAPGPKGDGTMLKSKENREFLEGMKIPAVFWSVPPIPGKTIMMEFDWDSAIEAVDAAVGDSGELLVIPEAREEEALEELGDKVILASRVRILDTKRDSTSVLLRVKALDTVQLKKLVTGDTLGFPSYLCSRHSDPMLPPGINGDGLGDIGEMESLGSPDLDLERQVLALPLSKASHSLIVREVNLLRKSKDDEATRLRRYLSLIASLPWESERPKAYTLEEAKEILDKEHSGLDDVKDRVLDFLAVKEWWYSHGAEKGNKPRDNLLLIGPPGTGKTTIARSIAKAFKVPLEIISLGGVWDPTYLLGLNRGYVGAQPGAIILALQRAGSRHLVLVLDELDKLMVGNEGKDCTGTLLSLLDEVQQKSFRDHFMEIPFDLSTVTFIATANSIEGVNEALLDRFEKVQLRGYSPEEKERMAWSHLLPRLYEELRVNNTDVEFTPAGVSFLVHDFDMEAGVRRLTERLRKVLSAAIRKCQMGSTKVTVTPEVAKELLNSPLVVVSYGKKVTRPGSALFTFVEGGGGGVGILEVALVPRGKGVPIMTGGMETVIKESATMALSLVRVMFASRSDVIKKLSTSDIHIHFPDAAVMKDGPSAGCSLDVALISALFQLVPKDGVAMTGEATLHGEVMPIGGTVEKILGVVRNGCKIMIVPKDNQPEVAKVPSEALEKIEIIYVERIEEVLKVVFGEDFFKKVGLLKV